MLFIQWLSTWWKSVHQDKISPILYLHGFRWSHDYSCGNNTKRSNPLILINILFSIKRTIFYINGDKWREDWYTKNAYISVRWYFLILGRNFQSKKVGMFCTKRKKWIDSIMFYALRSYIRRHKNLKQKINTLFVSHSSLRFPL